MATLPFASPIITSIAIQDLNLYVYRGSTVTFGIEVRNNGVYQSQNLMDLTDIPMVTLFNPLLETIVDDDIMTRIAKGKYGYAYHTQHTDVLGLWTARLSVRYLNNPYVLDDVGIFYLKDASFAVFTYVSMVDAAGVVWFIWIDAASQINITRELPVTLRVATPLNAVPVTWLKVDASDTMNPFRWLWIDVAGQMNVSFVEPMTTPGWSDDLIFTATDGRRYRLQVDNAEQVIVVPVVNAG